MSERWELGIPVSSERGKEPSLATAASEVVAGAKRPARRAESGQA